jgi:hypothetical protein
MDVQTSYHAQRPLRPDEQLLQVITSVVLYDLRPQVEHLAVRQHCLEPEDVRAEGTVLDHVLPAGVGRGVAADHAGALSAQVERGLAALCLEELIESLEDHSRLDSSDRAHGVELLDTVHVSEAEDDLVKDRDAATDETGVTALRDDCQFALVAVLEYLRHLLRILRAEEQLRVSFNHFGEAKVIGL